MVRTIQTIVLTAALAGLLGTPGVMASEKTDKDKATAKLAKLVKDIFYVPDARPTAAPSAARPMKLALKYKILLQRGNTVMFVPESFVFQKGDQFRIHFEGNATGYLYIFNKGTSGQNVVLFPDKHINGGKNQIPAHVEAVVPATGWYQFDEKPGTEQLYIFYTPKPIAELEAPVASGVVQETTWQQVVTTVIQRTIASKEAKRTKDIVYVEEGMPVAPAPAQPAPSAVSASPATPPSPTPPTNVAATYAATETSEGDGLLIHDIKLNHR